jgi:hypothetical protein
VSVPKEDDDHHFCHEKKKRDLEARERKRERDREREGPITHPNSGSHLC